MADQSWLYGQNAAKRRQPAAPPASLGASRGPAAVMPPRAGSESVPQVPDPGPLGLGARQPAAPMTPAPQAASPAMTQGQAWDQYMRTGRNPLLGPSAPYGIFTPGGESDRIAGGPAARAMQPQISHPSLDALRSISSQAPQPYQPPANLPPSGQVTLGGRWERPGEPTLPNPMARQGYGNTGNPGLGLAPTNERDFTAQMDWQNPTATNFGGTLPTMISAPSGGFREGFLAGPVRDMSQKPQFPAALYEQTASGSLAPRSNGGVVAQRTAAAKEFNARPERQKYLEGRQKVLAERKAAVTEKAKRKDFARSEKVRIGRGHLTFEERLAAANPASFQQRKALEARMNGEQIARQMAMEADARKSKDANETRLEAAKIQANGVAAAQGQKLPYPGVGSAAPAEQVSPLEAPESADVANLTTSERAAALRNLPAATRRRIEDELTQKGRLSRIFTGVDQPGRGDALSRGMKNEGFMGFFGKGEYDPINRVLASGENSLPKIVQPRWGALKPDDLKDKPTDTPAQKRIKAELRASLGR